MYHNILMSWNELCKSVIISQYYDSQAEGRGFESRFPLGDNQGFSLVTGQAPDFC